MTRIAVDVAGEGQERTVRAQVTVKPGKPKLDNMVELKREHNRSEQQGHFPGTAWSAKHSYHAIANAPSQMGLRGKKP